MTIDSQPDRPSRTIALARAIRFYRCGWGRGRRHALHPSPRQPPHFVCSQTFGIPLLSHPRAAPSADLSAGQYSGLVGPVYIEPKSHPGNYDREVFLTLKEFEPAYSRGGDMAMDFLSPATPEQQLKDTGEGAMKASLAKGAPHGFEVGYGSFTINGRMLGHGEPIRVKRGERVLLPCAEWKRDRNPQPGPTRAHLHGRCPGWKCNSQADPASPGFGWGRQSESLPSSKMNHPGIWIMGDLADDDRHRGMGIVVEYAGEKGKPQWVTPKPFRWNYAHFGGTERGSGT